jgi:hypothetical protein
MKYLDYCNQPPKIKKLELNSILAEIATHEKWSTKVFDIKWACRYASRGEYENAYLNLIKILRCLNNLAA